MEDEFDKLLEEKLVTQGNPLMKDSIDCVLWKMEHENCMGCQHELGCCKFACIKLLARGLIQPHTYEIWGEMDKITEQVDQALDAKSVEEVRSIIL